MSSAPEIIKQPLHVGGITVNLASLANLSEPSDRPLAVLFVLHGRTGSAVGVQRVVDRVLSLSGSFGPANRDLVVVTFDHRNHGTRVVDANANNDWQSNNVRHAIDMYAIQAGTAADVSFLIDFLPPYLFPSGERHVDEWIVSGISLGGHSTWILLGKEPRINIGIPIIGCPDYLALMGPRASQSGLKVSAPHFPPSLLSYIKDHDPSSIEASSSDPSVNHFYGKKILVLCGAEDKLVPWAASKDFVEKLDVGTVGTKKVIVEDGAGHECTPKMVQELATFVWEHALKVSPKAAI